MRCLMKRVSNFRGYYNKHFSAIFLSYYDKITNFVPNKK